MKTYVDAAKLQEYTTKLVAKLKTIFTGTPQPAATVADMTDHDKLYVYTGSETGYSAGNLYYWDGTAWTSGGVYNSAVIETDTTLSVSGKAADGKATGDAIAAAKAVVLAEIAPAYSTSGTYAVGDYVIYNSGLQRCISPISTAEAWTAAHWVSVDLAPDLGGQVSALKAQLSVNGIVRIEPTGKGYYINTGAGANTEYGVSNATAVNLTPIYSSGGLSYIIENCSEGDEFTVSGTGASSGLLWAFLDSDNRVISSSKADASADGLLLRAPDGTAKLVVNYYSGGALYRGFPISKQLEIINGDINGKYEVNDASQVIALFKADSIAYSGSIYLNPAVTYKPAYIGDSYKSHLNGLAYGRIIEIPCKGFESVTYTTFVSSSDFGAVFIDENKKIIGGYVETSVAGEKTLAVPENAEAMIITVSPSIANTIKVSLTKMTVKELSDDVSMISDDVSMIKGQSIVKADASVKFSKINGNHIYVNSGLIVGTTTLNEVQTITNNDGYALMIPLDGIKTISYPVFKSSAGGISFMCDEDDVVIWAYTETNDPTNTQKVVNIPDNASYFILTVSAGLNQYNWELTLSSLKVLIDSEDSDEPDVTPFNDVNRNMCLAGIKTDILTNKIPYHRGYLFHLLQNNNNSLWYGTDFKHINKIGSVSYNPTLMRFAISPKDGRIIAVQRDTRNGIWVWDGTTETHLDSFASNPQAWLYNSGVDFINDGSDEYCIFAEYSGNVVQEYTLNVWRGKYPYTSESNWEIVFSQNQGTNITHFHMVRRDPWTNILYLTSGDSSSESKWWYSTDKGANWTLLVSGTDTGWGNSLCRTINFIFTEDYIYWATDHGEADVQHHTLNRIQRDSNTGIVDLSTKEQLTLLPQLYATNSLCYVESPHGLFMYDRIDTSSSPVFGQPIKMLFWDFDSEELVEIASLKLTTATWGGSRGKCYINYTNGKEVMPAMGFSIDTPCIFDLVCDNPSNIGTIAYDIGSKTIHTIDY